MDHSYSYSFRDTGRKSKYPYRPKKLRRLPPMDVTTETQVEGSEISGENEQNNIYEFDLSEIQNHDLYNMRESSVLEIQSIKKLKIANAPKKKPIGGKHIKQLTFEGMYKYVEKPQIHVEEWIKSGRAVPTTQKLFGKSPLLHSSGIDYSPLSDDRSRRTGSSLDSFAQLHNKNNRLPFLKDIILGGKQASPKLMEYMSSGTRPDKTRRHTIMKIKTKQIAPDDEEEISKLKTGEDAVAFFSRAKKNTPVKFVYLNRADSYEDDDKRREYRPYDLVVVKKDQCNPEHYTMSATGVVHVVEGEPTEVISLSGWMRESTLFNVLRRIRFFKYYLVYKCFKLWQKNARFKKYCKIRAKLSQRFFFAKETFVPTLLEIHEMTHNLQKTSLMDFGTGIKRESPAFLINEFLEMQEKQRAAAIKQFEAQMDAIESKLVKLCDSVAARSKVPDMNSPENIEAYLMGQLQNEKHEITITKKTKSMVEERKEAREKALQLKKARQEADMLGDFIRLGDYMAVESLIELAKNTLIEFKTMLSETKNIMYLVKLIFKGENNIVFQPTEQLILDMLKKNADGIISAAGQVSRLLYMRAFKLYFEKLDKIPLKMAQLELEKREKQWHVSDKIRRDEVFNQTREAIEKSLRAHFAKSVQYGKTFEGLKVWYKFGQSWNAEEYNKKTHTVSEFAADIQKVKTALTQLNRMNVSQDIGILIVESKQLKTVLQPLMTNILEQIKSRISAISREMCSRLLKEFTDRVRSMQERPNKLKDFALYVDNLKNKIKNQYRELMQQSDEMEKMYELAEKNNVEITTHDSVQMDQLKDIREKFVATIKEADDFVDAQIVHRRKELSENIQSINTQLLNIMATLRSGTFVSADSNPDDVIKELEKINETLDGIKQKIEVYREYQTLFNLHATEWANLREVEKQFQTLNDIWKTIDIFNQKTEEWETTDLEKLDVYTIDKEVEEFLQKSNGLHLAARNDVTALLKQRVNEWKARMPIVLMIGNKDLKPHHWQEIFAGMNTNAKGATYNLRQLATLRIYMFKDLIQRVSTKATGEADILRVVERIERGWREAEFVVKPYRDRKDAFKLGSVEEISKRLKADLATLQGMQKSPFIEGVRNKVSEWETRLQNISAILDQWLQCQKKWMYLENIFNSEDVQKQLHEEAAKFSEVDKLFREKMMSTNQYKNVLKATSEEGVLETFVDCNEVLEEVQQGLQDFLFSKRESYPPYNKLSDDELLDVITNARTISEIVQNESEEI